LDFWIVIRAGGPHKSGPKVFPPDAADDVFEPLFLDVFLRNRVEKRWRILDFRTRESASKSPKVVVAKPQAADVHRGECALWKYSFVHYSMARPISTLMLAD
jgi:hypothetical protein